MVPHGRSTARLALALSAAAFLSACEDKGPPPAPPSAAPASSQPAPAPGPMPTRSGPMPVAPSAGGQPAMPPGMGMTPGPGGDAVPVVDGAIAVFGFKFPVPQGWKSVAPANAIRLAELQAPDASGDAAKTCIVAFSTAGGDVQSNISRWAGQVLDAAGNPTQPTVTSKSVAGSMVTIAEMTGTFVGMAEARKDNWTLRGAIVESPAGLLFVKMTGPAEPMKAAAPGFLSMMDGMKR